MTIRTHTRTLPTQEDQAIYRTIEMEKEKKKTERENKTIVRALRILESRLPKTESVLSSPETVTSYLKLKIGMSPYENFGIVFLNNQHGVINSAEIFRGTIDGASIYIREVVRDCIAHNAAAVIFYHNHPSGRVEPSQADECITERLKRALAMIDVRVLDHFIVGGDESYSFAENGLI